MATKYQYILIIFMRCSNDAQRELANRVSTITDKDPFWDDNVKTSDDWLKADNNGVEAWYCYPQARERFTQVIRAFNDPGQFPSAHGVFAPLRKGRGALPGLTDVEIAELRTFCTIEVVDLSLGGDAIEQAVTDHLASYGYTRVFENNTP